MARTVARVPALSYDGKPGDVLIVDCHHEVNPPGEYAITVNKANGEPVITAYLSARALDALYDQLTYPLWQRKAGA